jgi:opacity protein-like surface antigen
MKILIMTALAVSLVSTSMACMADGGGFFVNADAGQASYHVASPSNSPLYLFGPFIGSQNGFGNSLNKSDAAGALRFGYRWHSVVDYGVELGYTDLGRVNSTFENQQVWRYQNNLSDRGWLLGGNLKYDINSNWYVSARGGWYRPQLQGSGTASSFSPCGQYVCPLTAPNQLVSAWLLRNQYGYSQTVTGEYFGAGAGFNFSSSFSLGLSYDYYRSGRINNAPNIVSGVNVSVLSVSAEYRF